MKVRLVNDVEIQARGGSAGVISLDGDTKPDWGLYLDDQWLTREVDWPHQVVAWPDFGLPHDEPALFAAVLHAWDRAEAGDCVEIACAGGLGRTGTVVACLAVRSGVPANDAVQWTRGNYDPRAVETREQEDMIGRFGAWLELGGTQ